MEGIAIILNFGKPNCQDLEESHVQFWLHEFFRNFAHLDDAKCHCPIDVQSRFQKNDS